MAAASYSRTGTFHLDDRVALRRWPPRPLEAAELVERLAREWRRDQTRDQTAPADLQYERCCRLLDKIRFTADPPTSVEEWAHRNKLSRTTVYKFLSRKAKVRVETRVQIETAILREARELSLIS